MFQFYNLIPSLTARENVALVTEIAERPDGPGGGAAPGRPGRAPRPFPGAALGRRAAARRDRARHRQAPEVLLCDEPTGALDSQTGVLVLEAIERVNRELGTTTALITHNAVIAEMADRVMRLADGRIQHERATPRGVRRASWCGEPMSASARPQAAARSLAPARPGARHRARDRLRRRDARDVADRARGAARARRPRTTSASASPTCSRSSSARPSALPARIAAIPGVQAVETRVVRAPARRGRASTSRSSGQLVSVPERGEPLLNRLALRAGATRSPARRRGRAVASPSRARTASARATPAARHQRPLARAHGRRRRAVARVRLRDRRRARSCPTTGASACSGWAARRCRRLRHGGRLQRRLARAAARRRPERRRRRGSIGCSPPTAGSAPTRARISSRTGSS